MHMPPSVDRSAIRGWGKFVSWLCHSPFCNTLSTSPGVGASSACHIYIYIYIFIYLFIYLFIYTLNPLSLSLYIYISRCILGNLAAARRASSPTVAMLRAKAPRSPLFSAFLHNDGRWFYDDYMPHAEWQN